MAEQHFTTPHAVRLHVKLGAGAVQVTTVDGDQSTVRLEGSPKLLDSTSMQLVGDRLLVEQRRKSLTGWLGRWQEPLHVHAEVPHRSHVEITTASADATLDGELAGLAMSSASGGVVVVGEIDGDAEVRTVSGDARLPRVAGNLSFQSVSGDVEAESVGGSALAKSVSGDVRVGSLREGKADVQSVSGNVALGIASGTNIDVDAASASGALSSEVPLSDTERSDRSGPKLVIRSNTVSGDLRVFRAV
jgi:DUF4097 and DUF4098 domain-containing protein YvlB